MKFFNEQEQQALTEYCTFADISEEAACRHAFRLFQSLQIYMQQGMELCFRKSEGEIVRPFYHPKLEPLKLTSCPTCKSEVKAHHHGHCYGKRTQGEWDYEDCHDSWHDTTLP